MSKVLLITDQHFGVRNDNQYYVERYQKFYGEIVLPYIDEHGITEILCLGDTFDKRKSINFSSLSAAHDMWFGPLAERGIRMTMLVGNHDIYYKNTLKVSAPELLLREYSNIQIVSDPTEMTIGGRKMLLLPWICDDNRSDALNLIKKSKATYCMGHLELKGFQPIAGFTMDHGTEPDLFSKFKLVCSGHYHLPSRKNQIVYLGNPYQLYWNDYGSDRGFHILNTKDYTLDFVKNPYNTFSKVYYKDGIDVDVSQLEGTYVKLIVEEKNDQLFFDQTVRKLQKANLADFKIIEDISYGLDDVEDVEIEDTLSILETCVSDMKNKQDIFGILKSLYMEALEV
nr:gp47 recombination endonuclease [uncultured Mediterranean phage uvMED]|tara:strand:- start:18390 stop:19412 length:1023 start_codon:yes stop_codon:yes gene_type:complete